MLQWATIAVGLLFVGILSSLLVLHIGYARGKPVVQIKEEMEVAKSTFTVLGAVGIVFTLGFSLNEFALKQRAEDRQQIYGALGQLVDAKNDRPEISAAALLQLGKLGAQSRDEVPALLRIVSAYITVNAKMAKDYHDSNQLTRPDIQIAMEVLSELIGSGAGLGELVVLKDADLRHARLEGSTFQGITLRGVNFSNSLLSGSSFAGAHLNDLSFEDCDFSDVDLSGAVLESVKFNACRIDGTNFCAATRHNVTIDGDYGWDRKCLPR